MRADQLIQQAVNKLEHEGVGTARLDTLVLMEDVTGRDRAWLLAHPEHELAETEVAKIKKLIEKRAQHLPLAYVRGKTEFYGREFIITPSVLEPRPESETMIDLLKQLPDLPAQPRIADVGAGSGALGITAQLELPGAHVELLEIDVAALQVAQSNVDKFTLNITCLKSDLLNGSSTLFDVLLCNLPYVPDDFHINQAANREPKIAIFGGPDGLDVYRKLFEQLQKQSNKSLYFLSESLPPQHTQLAAIAAEAGYQLQQTEDFIQVFKRV